MTFPTLTPHQQDIFLHLEREVTEMHYRWIVFRQLFVIDQGYPEKSMARFDLMRAIAPMLLLQEIRPMMLDAAFPHICRITERAEKKDTKTGKVYQRNLVVERLRMIVDSLSDPAFAALAADLTKRHDDIVTKCKPLRKHRNKRISHLDMDVLLTPSTAVVSSTPSLPPVTIQMIGEVLDTISQFANEFRKVFLGSPMYFKGVVSTDDGDSFIDVLKRGYAFGQLALLDETLRRRIDEGPFGKA